MKNSAKRRLYQQLRERLYAAGVPLEYVHFQGFLRREDRYPDSRRFILVSLVEVQKKLARASMTMRAVWSGTGRYRIQVRDNYMDSGESTTFQQRSNQAFNLDAIVGSVQNQVAIVRDMMDEEQELVTSLAQNEAEVEKIDRTFSLDEVSTVEGWDQLAEVVVTAQPEGLTLAFNVRMTPQEVRSLLGRARELGLLPGGVRQKDQTVDPKVRSRFQRV